MTSNPSSDDPVLVKLANRLQRYLDNMVRCRELGLKRKKRHYTREYLSGQLKALDRGYSVTTKATPRTDGSPYLKLKVIVNR